MNRFRVAGALGLVAAFASGQAAPRPADLATRPADSCAAMLGVPLAIATLAGRGSHGAPVGGPEWSAVDESKPGTATALNLPDRGTRRYAASLETPAFIVPPSGIVIGFAQRRDWSWANTAGVLEIARGDRDFIDITRAGGRFLEGAYDGRSFASNPLGERPAWTAAPDHYAATRVLLPAALAGQRVRLRLRAGSAGTGDEAAGWYVTGFACSAPTGAS